MAIIFGSEENDNIVGTSENDIINGFGGDDIVDGAAGNDEITGDRGNDVLTGGSGSDRFVYTMRNSGLDTITDFIQGQDRIDFSLFGVGDFAQIQAFITPFGNGARLALTFNSVAESITINNVLPTQLTAADFIFDIRSSGGQREGSAGDDILFGLVAQNQLNGRAGNDQIIAGNSDDVIDGGEGDDTLTGRLGRDVFLYTTRRFGSDIITDFSAGSDRIDLTSLRIGAFSQLQPFIVQDGTGSRLTLMFGDVAHTIRLNNVLPAELRATDFILETSTFGFSYNGTSGADTLLGSLGRDWINGGRGDDIIDGGAGNDSISGDRGNDTLTGGAGADAFTFSPLPFGNDVITDFVQGQDIINLIPLGIGEFSQLLPFITQAGSGSLLTLVRQSIVHSIEIRNVLPSQLTAADFGFETFTDGLTMIGTDGDDTQLGSLGGDTIDGFAGNDHILAGAGNDRINGGSGDDIIDGGAGIDTVVLFATRAQLTVTRNAGGLVTTSSALDGTDRISGVEILEIEGTRFSFNRFLDTGALRVADFTVGAGGWTTQDRFPRTLADVNGDGRADIIGFGQAGTLVALGQAGGNFAAPFVAVADFGQDQGWRSANIFHRELADVNGDGREDIVGFGTAGVLVALAQAGGTFGAPILGSTNFNPANGWTSQDQFARTLADVNGDGFADIIGFGVAGTFVALGTGTGSFGATAIARADFGANQGWTSNNQFHREVGDVNGDGRADIVGFGSAGTLVALGQANGSFAGPALMLSNFGTSQGWTSQDLFPRDLADVNGDGRADIVGFGSAGTFIANGQPDGTFSAAAFDLADFGRDQGWSSDNIFHRELADVNGDGRADIVGFGQNGVFVGVAFDGQVI